MNTLEENRKRGRKNRARGGAFEREVRADMEKKRWFVTKWLNNVEFTETESEAINNQLQAIGTGINAKRMAKIIPAKHIFNPFTKAMSAGNGLPDFLAFKPIKCWTTGSMQRPYEVIGVEAKVGKYLDAEEKEKFDWYLRNKIFSKILVAFKNKKRHLEYYEYGTKIK